MLPSAVRGAVETWATTTADGNEIRELLKTSGSVRTESRPTIPPSKATVFEGERVSDGENKAVEARSATRRSAKEKLQLSAFASIGFAFSGGGMRAFYETLAFLEVLLAEGFLDTADWISALSGSVWAVTACSMSKFSPELVLNKLAAAKETWLPERLKSFFAKVYWLVSNDLILDSVTDIYAELIRVSIFDPLGASTHDYSKVTQKDIDDQHLPFHILSAAVYEGKEWLEITPFEVSTTRTEVNPTVSPAPPLPGPPSSQRDYAVVTRYTEKRFSIPTEAFCAVLKPIAANGSASSSAYERAVCSDFAKDDVAFICAAAGSAFCAEAEQIWESIQDKVPASIRQVIDYVLSQRTINLANAQLVKPAQVFDFRGPSTPLGRQFSVVDAGMIANIPVAPLLRRRASLIVIFDSSAGVRGQELCVAQQWAAQHGFEFPEIPPIDRLSTELKHKSVLVFRDKSKTCPTVIYVSGPTPTADYPTTKWRYSANDIAVIRKAAAQVSMHLLSELKKL